MNIFIFILCLILPLSSNAEQNNTFSWNSIPFCPHRRSNILRNHCLLRKSGYTVKFFNFFLLPSENICIAFFCILWFRIYVLFV